jgi:hypothetical protein
MGARAGWFEDGPVGRDVARAHGGLLLATGVPDTQAVTLATLRARCHAHATPPRSVLEAEALTSTPRVHTAPPLARLHAHARASAHVCASSSLLSFIYTKKWRFGADKARRLPVRLAGFHGFLGPPTHASLPTAVAPEGLCVQLPLSSL